jgi:pimeloyl-ACP methyl ester carboxylesterase
VPSITFDGTDDGVMPVGGTADLSHHFIGRHEHRTVQGAGHNLPQENPQAFVDAVRDLVRGNIGR